MLSHKVLTWSSWFSSKYLKSLETWNFSKFNFHCFHRSQISFHFNSMHFKIKINPKLGEFLGVRFTVGLGGGGWLSCLKRVTVILESWNLVCTNTSEASENVSYSSRTLLLLWRLHYFAKNQHICHWKKDHSKP